MRLAGLWLAGWAVLAQAQTWVVKDVVRVDGSSASLAQMLESPAPAALVRALEARPLVTGMRAGESRVVARQQLQAAWHAAQPDWSLPESLRAPERVVVTRNGGAPAGPEMARMGEAALRERLAGACAQLDIRPEAMAKPPQLPAQGVRLAPRVPAAPALAGKMAVWLDAFEGGALYGSWPVWYAVRCLRPVYRAIREIDKGEPLSTANAAAEMADATIGRPLAAWRGAVAARRLAEGSVLQEADAAPAPLVRKGNQVMARLNSGPIRMEIRAEALSDGAEGQVVYARRGQGQPAFKARVVSDGVVEVL
ncbi:flagellar basal body P-ring formation chaperone FlgA [Chromobacterium alticapitis]|uniref:Flagella basal body P-ring formation protein FlgA n=1 Tax=Chromobacterium alticapitis TaxID=2073169 RepID=A0A2S5DL78_9NEIS|nr:flagellar basal body P-ring formation chaperone FlgA [Chromobacterium alticapitis]POZ63761.1 flagella basal body P-ring formation protein FlgA [Chromobacterium alticapitis]